MSPTAPHEPSALNLRLGPLEQTLLEQAACVVDRAYEDPGNSDLKAEVKPQRNDFVFKLRRTDKPPR